MKWWINSLCQAWAKNQNIQANIVGLVFFLTKTIEWFNNKLKVCQFYSKEIVILFDISSYIKKKT